MKSNSEYRKSALASLKGHWKNAALATLIFLSIIILSSIIDYIAFGTRSTKLIESYNMIYTVLVIFPATFAIYVVFLRIIRKPETNILHSFFSHCTSNYGRATLSMLLLSILCTIFAVGGFMVSLSIASIPFALLDIPFGWSNVFDVHSLYGLTNIFRSVNLLLYVLLCGFFFLLTIIPMLMYIYRICLFPFIIEDNPDIGIRDAYHHSKVLMAGHRKQLFLLDLSFIGWYILCPLTLGIGLLWIIPYQQTARAHFYNELKLAYDKAQYLSFN